MQSFSNYVFFLFQRYKLCPFSKVQCTLFQRIFFLNPESANIHTYFFLIYSNLFQDVICCHVIRLTSNPKVLPIVWTRVHKSEISNQSILTQRASNHGGNSFCQNSWIIPLRCDNSERKKNAQEEWNSNWTSWWLRLT